METMAISKFKATCLSVLERVRKTGRPVLVTRFGKPIAEVVPPRPAERSTEWMGSMAGSAEIVGDIVSASGETEEWEVERE